MTNTASSPPAPISTSHPTPSAGTGRRVMVARFKEWLAIDCVPIRWLVGWAGLVAGLSLWYVDRLKSLAILTTVHRANLAQVPSRHIERLLRDRPEGEHRGYLPHRLSAEFQQHLNRIRASPLSTPRAEDPVRLLGLRILVLKSPATRERGVLVLDYDYVFPAFLKYFDVQRVMDEYYLVLESSWTGFANLNLLTYSAFSAPVFIQASEPRDAHLLGRMRSNLLPVPIGGNWWVDHRVFTPLHLEKDVDLIMVAAWAPFKRHERVFAAMAALKRRGRQIHTVLVGYGTEQGARDIANLAAYHGVRDQIEMIEGLTPEGVNFQYNRARANILWSRREGFNRALIEGMFADVPCILREGHNYGFHYRYVNPQTGVYANERSLPDTLLEVCQGTGGFRPREWVMNEMTCQRAAAVLNTHIRDVAVASGEAWTTDIVVKHSELDASRHWNREDATRFQGDYRRLAELIRT